MKDFATLINALDSTNKTSLKQEAIIEFLKVASSRDKLWFLALFTGKKPHFYTYLKQPQGSPYLYQIQWSYQLWKNTLIFFLLQEMGYSLVHSLFP